MVFARLFTPMAKLGQANKWLTAVEYTGTHPLDHDEDALKMDRVYAQMLPDVTYADAQMITYANGYIDVATKGTAIEGGRKGETTAQHHLVCKVFLVSYLESYAAAARSIKGDLVCSRMNPLFHRFITTAKPKRNELDEYTKNEVRFGFYAPMPGRHEFSSEAAFDVHCHKVATGKSAPLDWTEDLARGGAAAAGDLDAGDLYADDADRDELMRMFLEGDPDEDERINTTINELTALRTSIFAAEDKAKKIGATQGVGSPAHVRAQKELVRLSRLEAEVARKHLGDEDAAAYMAVEAGGATLFAPTFRGGGVADDDAGPA